MHPFIVDCHETEDSTDDMVFTALKKFSELRLKKPPDMGMRLKNYGNASERLQQLTHRFYENPAKRWDHLSWQSLAARHGLIFHNEISPRTFFAKFKRDGFPRNLLFPVEGSLPRNLLIEFLNVCKKSASGNAAILYQAPPHTIWKDGKPDDIVSCPLDELLFYFPEDFIGYLFAADRSWIIFTDNDLCYTLLGCTLKFLHQLQETTLKVIACNSNDRVDDRSDGINELTIPA